MLDKLAFGNEGARQRERCKLPAMSDDYIDTCGREIARTLVPSGYCMRWLDTFSLCEGHHLRADVLKPVDLISWDNLRPGMGKRSRRRGDYLLVQQKPPVQAQEQLALAGLTSEAARGFLEKLPGIETLMPQLSFAEIAGEADPPVAEQLVSPNALRQRRYRERKALRGNSPALRAPGNDEGEDE